MNAHEPTLPAALDPCDLLQSGHRALQLEDARAHGCSDPAGVVEVQAVRIGPWKSHLMIREGFFDHFQPSSLIFNLRMDRFERHGGQKSNDLAMKMGVAFGGQIQDVVNAHMATFQECKPRQEGGTVRMGGQ